MIISPDNCASLIISPYSYRVIFFVINLFLRFIFRFERFHEDFTPSFTLSIPFTSLSLSPLYPYQLSIPFTYLSLSTLYPFTSISLSPLYPFHLSLISPSPSVSLLLPFFLSLSFYLSFSLSPSLSILSIILFRVSTGRFRPC